MSAEKFTSRPVPSQASPALREYLEDQISRLQLLANAAALREEEETITGDWTFSGSLTIPQASVTDHQAALALAASQITSGTFANARIAQGNVTQHQAALALAASQITSGTFANARIAQGNVTQHQAALAIAETQITDGALLARVAANETISGLWTFTNSINIGINQKIVLNSNASGTVLIDFVTSRPWQLRQQGTGSSTDLNFVSFSGGKTLWIGEENNLELIGLTTSGGLGMIEIAERATTPGARAGFGRLWVKNTSPSQLWFTDDDGTDHLVS